MRTVKRKYFEINVHWSWKWLWKFLERILILFLEKENKNLPISFFPSWIFNGMLIGRYYFGSFWFLTTCFCLLCNLNLWFPWSYSTPALGRIFLNNILEVGEIKACLFRSLRGNEKIRIFLCLLVFIFILVTQYFFSNKSCSLFPEFKQSQNFKCAFRFLQHPMWMQCPKPHAHANIIIKLYSFYNSKFCIWKSIWLKISVHKIHSISTLLWSKV